MSQARAEYKFNFSVSYKKHDGRWVVDPMANFYGITATTFRAKVPNEKLRHARRARAEYIWGVKFKVSVYDQDNQKVFENEGADFDAMFQAAKPYWISVEAVVAETPTEAPAEVVTVAVNSEELTPPPVAEEMRVEEVVEEDAKSEATDVIPIIPIPQESKPKIEDKAKPATVQKTVVAPKHTESQSNSNAGASFAMAVVSFCLAGALFMGGAALGFMPLAIGPAALVALSIAVVVGITDYVMQPQTAETTERYRQAEASPARTSFSREPAEVVDPLAWKHQSTPVMQGALTQHSYLARTAVAEQAVITSEERVNVARMNA